MMRQTLYLILMLNAASIFGQQYNVELIANVKSYCGYTSDIWAYVAPDGHEYAAMGVSYGIIIYDLAEPSNPRELIKIYGAESIHHDLKHYKEKIYVVTEGESNAALLVIDMSSAPASISWEYVELYSSSYDAQITDCHNLYIDSLGIMYLAGCNVGGGSLIIYDLNSSIPKEISEANTFTNYTHDIFVRDNLAYLSNVHEGAFKIYNIQDLSAPRLLASEFTKATVTHNAWPSDDGNYLFTTDESYRGGVDAYNISDFDNVEFLDTYKPISDLRSMPHNTHYYNGYLITSYYEHGIRIIDAHRPSNLVEVGYFQTGTDRVNADCWGVTPFLPSDLIIGSDINNGLFVLKPTYERASYLEGFVKSTLDSRGINEVKITILDSYANEEISIFDGSFKTGLVKEGEFQVLFQHFEYYDTIFTANLTRTDVTQLTAFMRPKEVYNLNAKVIDNNTFVPLDSVYVEIRRPPYFESTFTNSFGIFNFDFLFGVLEIINGKWGYEFSHKFIDLNSNQDIEIPLAPKYEDNFYFDLGWNKKSLSWSWAKTSTIRESWFGTIVGPSEDSADFGDEAFIFDYLSSASPQLAELISPAMNLLPYNQAILNFEYFSFLRPMERDSAGGFYFGLYNKGNKIYIDTITNNIINWTSKQVNISDYIELSDSVAVFFEIASNHRDTFYLIYQAGIDNFSIIEGNPTNIKNPLVSNFNIKVFPNPFKTDITIESTETKLFGPNLTVHLYNLSGHRIKTYHGIEFNGKADIKIPDLSSGIYIIKIQQGKLVSKALKVLKL